MHGISKQPKPIYSAVDEILKPLVGQPWAMVTNLDDWELFTPDCGQVMQRSMHFAYSSGLIREVLVNRTNSIKMESFTPTIAGCPKFQRHFVKTKAEAFEWLNSQGFDAANHSSNQN